MTKCPSEMNNLELFSVARSTAKKCYFITRTTDEDRQKELFNKAKTQSKHWPYTSISDVTTLVQNTISDEDIHDSTPLSFEQKTDTNSELIYTVKDDLLSGSSEPDEIKETDTEKPSINQLRKEILDGRSAKELAEKYGYSTYKVKKLIKQDRNDTASNEQINPLTYNTDKQQWEEPNKSEKRGKTNSKENKTANTNTNKQDSYTTGQHSTEQESSQPVNKPSNSGGEEKSVQRDMLKRLYDNDVLSIAEGLYDCFIDYNKKYTEISKQHPNIEFPLRQKALEKVSNTAGKTKTTRIKNIAAWVNKWYDNEEKLIDLNNSTPKPMGMK